MTDEIKGRRLKTTEELFSDLPKIPDGFIPTLRPKPRVMTLDEVKEADFVDLEFQDVIWGQCSVQGYPDFKDGVLLVDQEHRTGYFPEDSYNDEWRCWTDLPTPKERKETPWDESAYSL